MKRMTNTKHYIKEALIKLLKSKQMNDISISDVVKTAGVARASFYRNFYDMNDLIDYCFSETINEIFSSIDESDLYEYVLNGFKGIKRNEEFFTIMKKHKLLSRINDVMYHKTLEDINRLNVFNNNYQPYFFAGASSFMIQAWIDGGFKENEEKLTKIFFESLKGYMTLKEHM